MAEREKQYWLHRITGGENAVKLTHPLLFEHGILSTGWARCSWDDFVKKSIGDWETFLREFGYEYPSLGNYRSLWNFLQMQEGDIVVVPTYGEFSIYRVADNNVYTNESLSSIISIDELIDENGKTAYVDKDKNGYSYLFDADGEFIDLGFFRKVTPIAEYLSRSLCDDTLRNYLGNPRTNININAISTHVDNVINSINFNKHMAHIRLDRTFWPVGHGAFYTERFYDYADNRLFTAIYDCGSENLWLKTNNGKTLISTPQMKALIERFMPSQYASGSQQPIQDIDIAFISHLHSDHINGIPVLLPRIKKLVLPHLSDCKVLEALLHNVIVANTDGQGEINYEGEVDIESGVQQFILQLARGRFDNDNIQTTIVEIDENEGEPSEEPINIEHVAGSIRGGSSLLVQISRDYPIYWIYKPVNVDFSQGKCDEIIRQLNMYAPGQSIAGNNGKIDWTKVAIAVKSAGLKKIIDIYKSAFGITNNSALHNSYSMPVYSGPADYMVDAGVRVHIDSRMHSPFWQPSRYEHDVFFYPFYEGPIQLGKRCKLLSCLYMGDFNAGDNRKISQLRRILNMYYDRVGIQQVPHHFSDGNRCAELYRGPFFAFGNISDYTDRSFKRVVVDEDIARFGCVPFIITKDPRSMVKFEYKITLY